MDAPRHQRRLDRLSIKAQRQIALGSAEKGAEICRILIKEWTDIEGPDGDKVLVWRGFLGRALTEAQHYAEAEEVLADLLVDRERVLGADDPSTFVTRGNLARAIALGGRPREAIFHAERLLADRRRVLGPNHPATLDSMGHLAHFHFIDAQFDRAVEMYGELLDRRTEVLGEGHPDTLQTEINLAACRAKSGRSEDIEELLALALEMQDDIGFENIDTLNVFALLADSYRRAGNLDEALRVAHMTVDGRSRVLGDGDARTLSSRSLVARIYLDLGHFCDAIDETNRILELHRRQGREGDVAGIQIVVDLLSAVSRVGRITYLGLRDQDIKDLVRFTHWLEQKSAWTELSAEYSYLASEVRGKLARSRE